VEESFSFLDNLDLEPMIDERTEKQRKSVDRARAQSHLILCRSFEDATDGRRFRAGQKPGGSR